MPTSFRPFFIALGTPTVTQESVTIFESGQAGTLGAKRILTHPDDVNFSPITYYKNPTRTFNLDNDVLPDPRGDAIRTLQGRQVVRFPGTIADVVVTEIWEGADNSLAAMPTSQFRQLYEYLVNPPDFDAIDPTFIQYQPRDRNDFTYNVQLYRIRVGSGNDERIFDVDDFRLPDSAEIQHPLETMDVVPDGLITRQVEVSLRIVSKAA